MRFILTNLNEYKEAIEKSTLPINKKLRAQLMQAAREGKVEKIKELIVEDEVSQLKNISQFLKTQFEESQIDQSVGQRILKLE